MSSAAAKQVSDRLVKEAEGQLNGFVANLVHAGLQIPNEGR
jgi:hypothetical protein